MHEHIRTLLNAYLDGELHGSRLQEVKNHLVTCETCRKELGELRRISEQLQVIPEPEFLPAGRFAANLNLHLPRRAMRGSPFTQVSLTWWLVPAALMAAWLFVQTLYSLTDVATAAQLSGLLGQASTWLGAGRATLWFNAATGLFGQPAVVSQPALTTLNALSVLGENLLEGFLWQALIAFLYFGWLGALWMWRRPRSMSMEHES